MLKKLEIKKQATQNGAGERRPLCLMCTQGPVHSIHHPSRLKELVHFSSEQDMVIIEPLLLSIGLFIGRARPCHLRLEEIERLPPVAAIRYDRNFEWSLTGLADCVRVNGQFLDGKSVQLAIGDRVRIAQYELLVADPRGSNDSRIPDADEENEEPLEVIEEPGISDTTFELQMPDFPNN